MIYDILLINQLVLLHLQVLIGTYFRHRPRHTRDVTCLEKEKQRQKVRGINRLINTLMVDDDAQI